LLGCGEEHRCVFPPDGPPAPPDAAAVCLEATEHSDLAWLQDNLFTPSCASFNACHKGAALSAGGLSLEAGRTRDSMVNVASDLFPAFDMVVPGDPANSYLMIIMGQFDGPLADTIGTMPYQNPLVCTELRDAVQRWIEAGAPDTPP
jgi:hypothetical protein